MGGGTDTIWVAICCRGLLFGDTQLCLLCTLAKETFHSVNWKLFFKEEPRAGDLFEGASALLLHGLVAAAAAPAAPGWCIWALPPRSAGWSHLGRVFGTRKGTGLKEIGKDSKEWKLWKNKLSCDFILTLFALVLLSVHPLVTWIFLRFVILAKLKSYYLYLWWWVK